MPTQSKTGSAHGDRHTNNWIAVSAVILLSVGCHRGSGMPSVPRQPTSANSTTTDADQPRNTLDVKALHAYWTIGVLDPDAPNAILRRWMSANPPDPLRAESSSGVMQAIGKDEVSVLDIYHTPPTNELQARLEQLDNLEWLRLSAGVGPHDLEWIGTMRQLRGLSLAHANLKGAKLHRLQDNVALEWLDLRHVKIRSTEFRGLPTLPKLETLHLAGKSVTDEYLYHIASLRLPSLTSLTLYYTSITDAGVKDLCHAYNLSNLDLFCARDVTSESIEPISRMKSLRALGIGGTGICPDYTENASIQRLKQLLPVCSVDYGS